MKKVMVTGADGFIGSHLVQELVENGYEVYAVVRKSSCTGAIWENSRLHRIECDMNQYKMLLGYPELRQISAVFHFAWEGVSGAHSADYAVQLNNVKCACDLQTVASQLGIRRIVFADSIMEYEHIKAMENGICQLPLRNTYHVAKITARNLLQLRAANSGMEFIPVVISNVYGVGENSPRLINTAIRNLLARRHMSLTPGEQLYDFIYVSDAVRAIRMAAENGKNNKLYYIGNREQRPLKTFLMEMRDAIAPDMELGIGELKMQGISLEYTEIDTGAIYEDLGFEPQYTFLQGIKKTAEWMASEGKRGKADENGYSGNSNL